MKWSKSVAKKYTQYSPRRMRNGSRKSVQRHIKKEAVAKAEASGNVSQTARELGISDKTIHNWKQKFGTVKSVSATGSTSVELAARVARLEFGMSKFQF